MNKLSIQNASKYYRDVNGKLIEVFNDISFNVKDGDIVSIVGPSGCGKTTLLKNISGLSKLSDGNIILDNNSINGIQNEIGYVFQNSTSFPWLSVYKNIEFILKLKTNHNDSNSTINYLINLVGLEGFENAFVNTLSGGMKQRLCIAMSLAKNPDVLLMDEPSSAIDSQTRHSLQEFLYNVCRQTKKTVLFVTHDIEEAIFLSNKIIVLSNRPSRVISHMNINLPEKRDKHLRLSGEFIEIKRQIIDILSNF